MRISVFENKIWFKIYGPNLESQEADCDFETMFTDEKEPNTCKLRIYNLKDENMNAILTNTQYIEIYTNQYGEIDTDGKILWQSAFEGLLKDVTKKSKSTQNKNKRKQNTSAKVRYVSPSIVIEEDEGDDYIEIELQEGKGAEIGTFVSKSYKTGFNVKKILTDMASSIGMEIVFDKNIKYWDVTYPIILHDNVLNSLSKVAEYIGCKVTISKNRVYVTPKQENVEGVVSYYQFDESNIQQPNYLQDKKIEFTAPYIPNLLPGQFVKLINKKQNINGVFQIVKIESKFSNHSEDCESKITVKYE